MKVTELMKEFRTRCGGIDEERAAAMMSDYHAAGMTDGPALRDAFERWRVRWDKKYAPTPAEFRDKFYAGKPKIAEDDNSNMRVQWRRWRVGRNVTGLPIIEPLLTGQAVEMAKHVEVLGMDEDSVTIRPLTASVRSWWQMDDKRQEVERLIGREVVIA